MNRPSRTLAALSFLAILTLPLTALAADSADLFTRSLNAYGWWAALPSALLVGLATTLTPCVYPMIAITVSVFGARKASRGRAMALSTAFVLGIAAMFVPLGLVAGLSGSVAGAIAGNAAVQIFEAVLMFAMAASMFGAFEISLPGSVQNRLASIGGLGLKGAFLIGLCTGPIAAPCATAGLVGILDYVFRSQNAFAGGSALFAYSLGLGLPFWIVGTFAVGLPKPGRWMDYIKNVFGVVLVAIGFFYLKRFIPVFRAPPVHVPGAPWSFGLLIAVGIALGAVHLSLKDGAWGERLRKILSVGLAAMGAVWWLGYEPAGAVSAGACHEIAWQRNPAAAYEQAHRENRPILLDFGATWCRACEELAHKTFTDGRVACAASEGNFVSVKIYEDEDRPSNYDDLQSRYGVRGLPTVIVLDASGREVGRTTQFVPADTMAELLRRVADRRAER